MATDLRALRRRCEEVFGDRWEEAFWQKVRALATTDLLAYGLWVHGGEAKVLAQLAFAAHARVIARVVEEADRALVVTPPEHGKTTLLARWLVELYLGRETERAYREPGYRAPSVLLVSNTAGQAQKRIMSIAATIEGNARYRALFPKVAPDRNWGWGKDLLYLKRASALDDPSLQGSGCPGPIQGGRFGLIVVDDPTDQEDVRSESKMQTQVEFHQGVLDDRLLDGGKQVDILTRWGRNDIASVLLASDAWRCEVMPALGYWRARPEHGVAAEELWPEAWPLRRLDEKRRQKQMVANGALWQLAYLCNPVLAEGNLFQRAWLQYGPSPVQPYGVAA